ncbi:MAG: ImmA/IrrE family metallo-endopeptidase [Saprospiraceae bacterium]|nr:ImmA/IrrE family metallo-endopeptidase [Bacteroidota bacterium]MCB0673529.1 ImmA/IrrE family metallo-endopeptidase [Saprospiraceae bacterium]
MKEIFAKRLKSARLLSTMSMDKLVEAMGGIVSKNAIAKYERGEMMPNSSVLIALAKALSVKPDYFFRPFSVEIGKVDFRKKSKLGAKKINAIKEQVADQIERYLEIENLLRINAPFVNPIADIPINEPADIEDAVNTLLKKWKLGFNALPNLIELLEDKEIKVIELDADPAFDGLSGWASLPPAWQSDKNRQAVQEKKRVPIIVVNRNFPIERKRFTALHELGHLLLNFNENLSHKEIEKLCHCFAGAMLIPYDTFIDELGEHRSSISLHELISIKETYGISIQAIIARAYGLGIISQSAYQRFRIFVSKNLKEEGWGNYQGKEQSDRFMQLIYRAAAEEIISLSKAANLSNQKLAVFRDQFIPL